MIIFAIPGIIARGIRDFIADDALSLAAAIAFYSVLSMAPLALLAVSVAAAVGEDAAVRDEIVWRVQELIGPNVGQLARVLLDRRFAPGEGRTALVGAGLVLFAATTVFAQIQHSLNRVWGVKVKSGRWLWPLLRTRLVSAALIFLVGVLFVASVVTNSLIGFAIAKLDVILPGGDLLWQTGSFTASLAMTAVMFAMIFRTLPDARIAWNDAIAGAVLSAVMLAAGRELMELYLGLDVLAAAYGGAGSLVVLLLWVYYGSLLLLLGAEFTQGLARSRDRQIVPKPWAEPIPH